MAAGLVALIVAGGTALYSRWHLSQQSRLASRFAERVDRIDSALQMSYMLPRHDIAAARDMAQDEIEALAEDVAASGAIGGVPGDVALGRSHLMLGDYEVARAHLTRAWDNGQQTPGVALALGRTLGQLYARRIEAADRLSDAEVREEERRRAWDELAVPARGYLEGIDPAGPGPRCP